MSGRNTARGLLAAVALALVVALVREDIQSRVLIRRADAYTAAKEYGHAIESYGEVAVLRPRSALPHLRLGQVYLAQGRWDEAEAELTKTWELDTSEDEALVGLGVVAYQRHEVEGAVRRWREALVLNPRNVEAHYRLALSYLAASQFRLAEQELEYLVLHDRDHQEGHYYLGLLLAAEDAASASEHLDLALTGDHGGVSEAAEQMLALLSEVEGFEDEAYVSAQLGRAYLQQGVPGLAAAELEKVVVLEPDNYAARSYLGYALYDMGDAERARKVLREVTRLAPKYPLGYYFLGMLHRSEGYLHTASYDFRMALRLDPSNAAAYADLAETYRLLGQYLVAGEWYRAAVEVAPLEPDFRVLLAQFYVDVLPRTEEGLAAAREAVTLAPYDPLAQDLLGWAHYLAGDLGGAQIALEVALSLDPEFARAYYHLGVVSGQLGDEAQARWAYERAIDLDSEGTYRQRALTESGMDD